MSKKLRRYHATREVIDSKNQKHTILVYGELLQTNDDKGFILAPITYKKKDRNNIVSFDDKYVVVIQTTSSIWLQVLSWQRNVSLILQ